MNTSHLSVERRSSRSNRASPLNASQLRNNASQQEVEDLPINNSRLENSMRSKKSHASGRDSGGKIEDKEQSEGKESWETAMFMVTVFVTGVIGIGFLCLALKYSFQFIKTRIINRDSENKDDFNENQSEHLACALVILCCAVALKEFYKLKKEQQYLNRGLFGQLIHTENGLRKLSVEEFEKNKQETTKKELESLEQSSEYKAALRAKGDDPAEWNWQAKESQAARETMKGLNLSAFAGNTRYDRLIYQQKTSQSSENDDDKNGHECLESSFSESNEAKSEMGRGPSDQPLEVQLMNMDKALRLNEAKSPNRMSLVSDDRKSSRRNSKRINANNSQLQMYAPE